MSLIKLNKNNKWVVITNIHVLIIRGDRNLGSVWIVPAPQMPGPQSPDPRSKVVG